MEFKVLEQTQDTIIHNHRVFNVPIQLMREAWINPEHLKNWWGPTGFTNTFNEFDLRPHGKWDFIMHGPDKRDYHNECEFIITDPDMLVWNHISAPQFQMQVAFESQSAESTRLLFTMVFETAEACSKLRDFCLEKNEENFDRLQAELDKMKDK